MDPSSPFVRKARRPRLDVIYSSEEKISPRLLTESGLFNLTKVPIDTGDIVYRGNGRYVMVENKFGQDAHDYNQLKKELRQMAEFRLNKNPLAELHAVFCDRRSYEIGMDEYKRLVSFCGQFSVMPHHCIVSAKDPHIYANKLYGICMGEYDPEYYIPGVKIAETQLIRVPNANIETAAMLNVIKGLALDKALELSQIGPIGNCFRSQELSPDFLELIDEYLGVTKDGGDLALVKKIRRVLTGL